MLELDQGRGGERPTVLGRHLVERLTNLADLVGIERRQLVRALNRDDGRNHSHDHQRDDGREQLATPLAGQELLVDRVELGHHALARASGCGSSNASSSTSSICETKCKLRSLRAASGSSGSSLRLRKGKITSRMPAR